MPKSKKSAATEPIVIEFEFERETKNAFRFQEVTDEDRGVVGTLYVLKSAFGSSEAPESLTVTIEVS